MREHESQGYLMANLESKAFGGETNSLAGGTSRLSRYQPLLKDKIGDRRVIGTPRAVVGHFASRGSSENVSIMPSKFQLMTMDSLMRRAVEFLVLD